MTVPIIIVDDDKVERYIARRVVKEAGVDGDVVEYTSGDEFLAAMGEARKQAAESAEPVVPTLVFLDINMPRMNGFEVLEEIKQRVMAGAEVESCLVVMIVSSSNHAADKSAAFSYDFVKEFLVKPLSKERLRELVAKYYG